MVSFTMSKTLNTKFKIKVSDVLEGVMPGCKRTYFGYGGFCVRGYVTLEALRGGKYDTEVTAFSGKVAARHGRDADAALQKKVSGPNWRVELVQALNAAKEKAAEYKKSREDANARRLRASAAQTEYAASLGKLTGRHVPEYKVVMDGDAPAGVTLTVTLNGTAEQVAEKFSRLVALSSEYYKNSTRL